ADIPQGGLERWARCGEGGKLRKHASEPVVPEDESTNPLLRVSSMGAEKARRDDRYGAGADRLQQRPPTDPLRLIGGHMANSIFPIEAGAGTRGDGGTLTHNPPLFS